MAESEPTYKEIWDTLSNVDVSNHIEKKMKLSYLSWAWAWGTLMEHYPNARYHFSTFPQPTDSGGCKPDTDVMIYPDGTCSVHCTVMIGDCNRSMWLPVMDNRNNAIQDPSSRSVSDTKMRALVKTLAMFGLGHYIYAGEDLPGGKQDDGKVEESDDKPVTIEEEASEKDDGIVTILKTFAPEQRTMKELTNWWRKNKDELKKVEARDPKLYKEILDVFSERKSQIREEEENGK